MENFSEQLKKQREERKIRLSDVAVQTRISLKFLEALEAGNFEILPETYIRAFIRDYAKAIGLDPDETIRRYDLHVESIKAVAAQQAEETEKTGRKPMNLSDTQKIALAVAGLIVLVFLAYMAFSPSRRSNITTQNYDYENTQAVNERRFDSAYAASKAKPDSSRLVLDATDTVWVNLVVDDGKTFDLLMKPGTRLAFWGRKKFSMTVGNAGGLRIYLDGHEYPALGKLGVVVRNVTIYRDGTIKK